MFLYQCYLLHLAYFDSSGQLPFEMTAIFKAGFTQLVLVFAAFLQQCAAVVKGNERIVVENRRFFVAFFARRKSSKDTRDARDVLKAEALLAHKSLHGYAFKLSFTRYRISSKTFHLVN